MTSVSDVYLSVYILEWTRPSFSMGKLGTCSSFQVTYVFQRELYKMKEICLKCYQVLTKLCLYVILNPVFLHLGSNFKQPARFCVGIISKKLKLQLIWGKGLKESKAKLDCLLLKTSLQLKYNFACTHLKNWPFIK